MRIAVLLTTFNRKQKTVACLQSLQAQKLPEDTRLEVFLTDDASRDGTVNAVKAVYPGIYVYQGTGSLFWAGGMRNSWQNALAYGFDYYLLLNDDTLLRENAIALLLQSCEQIFQSDGKAAICVGSTVDQSTGEISYGGRRLSSSFSIKSYKVQSETDCVDCDLGNANIMLVPQAVVSEIGILSASFTHGIADYDYTLRAKRQGFRVVVAPGILGSCVDDHGKSWKSHKTSLKERIHYLKSPKGLAYHEYLKFIRSHFPWSYPSTFCKLWVKTLFPFVYDTFKK